MALPQLCWEADFLKDNPTLQDESYGIPEKVKHVHYPIRLVRYWFMYHFLREEIARQGRKLSVCEIGVDTGQMFGFMQAAARNGGANVEFAGWDAVDALIREDILRRAGYNQFYQVDLESPELALGEKQYNAMILLHVLEPFVPAGTIDRQAGAQSETGRHHDRRLFLNAAFDGAIARAGNPSHGAQVRPCQRVFAAARARDGGGQRPASRIPQRRVLHAQARLLPGKPQMVAAFQPVVRRPVFRLAGRDLLGSAQTEITE